MPSESINYDRAADFYDATRAYPAGVVEQLAEFIAKKALFKPDTNMLEIGIGTGRIALPMSAHVVSLIGVDISSRMMAKLDEKQTSEPIEVAQADAEQLPFAAQTFKNVFISHVLHLVSDPQRVLSEVARVLQRPGQLIHIRGINEHPPAMEALMNEWRKHRKSGEKSPFERMATDELISPIDWLKLEEHRFIYPDTANPARFLETIQNRWWSNTWELSEPEIEIAALALKRVATEQFGENYDVDVETTAGVVVQIYVPRK
jgi:ubiquinone/menaquinone biosynthesis C-methylase UbiE